MAIYLRHPCCPAGTATQLAPPPLPSHPHRPPDLSLTRCLATTGTPPSLPHSLPLICAPSAVAAQHQQRPCFPFICHTHCLPAPAAQPLQQHKPTCASLRPPAASPVPCAHRPVVAHGRQGAAARQERKLRRAGLRMWRARQCDRVQQAAGWQAVHQQYRQRRAARHQQLPVCGHSEAALPRPQRRRRRHREAAHVRRAGARCPHVHAPVGERSRDAGAVKRVGRVQRGVRAATERALARQRARVPHHHAVCRERQQLLAARSERQEARHAA
eukprot:349747-Chlamydomonas_euryale.AAC.4